jgi:hypothetical protein
VGIDFPKENALKQPEAGNERGLLLQRVTRVPAGPTDNLILPSSSSPTRSGSLHLTLCPLLRGLWWCPGVRTPATPCTLSHRRRRVPASSAAAASPRPQSPPPPCVLKHRRSHRPASPALGGAPASAASGDALHPRSPPCVLICPRRPAFPAPGGARRPQPPATPAPSAAAALRSHLPAAPLHP